MHVAAEACLQMDNSSASLTIEIMRAFSPWCLLLLLRMLLCGGAMQVSVAVLVKYSTPIHYEFRYVMNTTVSIQKAIDIGDLGSKVRSSSSFLDDAKATVASTRLLLPGVLFGSMSVFCSTRYRSYCRSQFPPTRLLTCRPRSRPLHGILCVTLSCVAAREAP